MMNDMSMNLSDAVVDSDVGHTVKHVLLFIGRAVNDT